MAASGRRRGGSLGGPHVFGEQNILKTCKFLVCTEGGMSHMAACMRIPFYIFGNFNRDNEEAFLELWQNYYAPHGIVTEDLITLKERVYET